MILLSWKVQQNVWLCGWLDFFVYDKSVFNSEFPYGLHMCPLLLEVNF